jgi:hypothetical protein
MAEVEEFESREIQEWRAFANIEPFGEERADARSGMEMALTANIHRDRKLRADPFQAWDFMPFLERPEEPPRLALLDDAARAALETKVKIAFAHPGVKG